MQEPWTHPTEPALERFLRGESSRPEAQAVVRHLLAGCAECGEVTRTLWRSAAAQDFAMEAWRR